MLFGGRSIVAAALACAFMAASAAPLRAFTFAYGDYYSTNTDGTNLIRYDTSGNILSTTSFGLAPGESTRGLAFGPDGLLYTVIYSNTQNYQVNAYRSDGTVAAMYPGQSFPMTNISYGKINFDDAGHFYVGADNGLTQFTIGDTGSARRIWTVSGIFSAFTLPNGNLLITDGGAGKEITTDGVVVRTIGLVDPNGIAPAGMPLMYYDVRAVAYDAANDSVIVTQLGYSGVEDFLFRIMSIQRLTGTLLAQTRYAYADSIYITGDGHILVGSRTDAPALYDAALNQLEVFDGPSRLFATEFTIPEPSFAAGLLLLGGAVAAARFLRTRSVA